MLSPASERRELKLHMEKIRDILITYRPDARSNGPVQLLDHLYIGSKLDAHDYPQLRRQGITHVFNCAAYRDYSREDFSKSPYEGTNSGVTHYEEIEALDNEAYPILAHFHKAKRFVDDAKRLGGRALVHCEMGVNRSGALCVAYMMEHENITLFRTLREVKLHRPLLLVNEGFQKQLLDFATERGLLKT